MSYGTMIREWRNARGWTQRQLAEAVGCTDGYIAHLEKELKLPSLDLCMALVQVLQRTPEEQQRLLAAVEAARRQQVAQRIRTRGAAVRGALRTRGSAEEPPAASPPSEPSPEQIARDLAADPDLQAAYRDLKTVLRDPQMRETALTMLRALVQACKPPPMEP